MSSRPIMGSWVIPIWNVFFFREAKRLATAASHQRKEQLPPPWKKKYFSLFQIYYFLTGCWPAAVITFSILSCAVREPGYLHADWEGPSSENPHTRKGLSISFFFFHKKTSSTASRHARLLPNPTVYRLLLFSSLLPKNVLGTVNFFLFFLLLLLCPVNFYSTQVWCCRHQFVVCCGYLMFP